MGIFEYMLEKLAIIQKRYPYHVIIIFLLFSVLMAFGVAQIRFSGDFSKEMPTDLPIYKLNDRIRDKFGGQDTIFILFEIDDSLEEKPLYDDIRHPEIIRYMSNLEDMLEHESSIDEVYSLGMLSKILDSTHSYYDIETVKEFMKNSPQMNGFVSTDNKLAIMMVKADVGTGEEKVSALTRLIEGKIEALSTPSGVKISVTGSPSIVVMILKLLKQDSKFTLSVASIIIFFLLIFTLRSLTKTLLVFIPLFFGLLWTLGAMGWLGIEISVATAGLGAMVLGLGVEYGVFILTRYREERGNGKNQEEAMKLSVTGVGTAVMGSGLTTIVGFLALTLSVMPLLQKLGLSLAIGIFFSIIAAIVLEPCVIVIEENIEYEMTHKKHAKLEKKKEIHRRLPR